MTRMERVESAIALDKPDRTPVMPLFVNFPIRHKGLTQARAWGDFDIAFQAILDTFNDLDGLDTDWGLNLPYFKKLSKGKCVADLDGTTDIFPAKEILGGHMCISGDVPAALLTLRTPDSVKDYCRKLIDEIGQDGGFMLTTGCECPV